MLNTTSLLLTLVMVAQSDAIAPVSVQVAKFIQSDAGLAGAIEILPIDFEIVVQPYSLITAKNRTLSPSALLLYTEIEASIGHDADATALRHAATPA
jgi:hypothetical protein